MAYQPQAPPAFHVRKLKSLLGNDKPFRAPTRTQPLQRLHLRSLHISLPLSSLLAFNNRYFPSIHTCPHSPSFTQPIPRRTPPSLIQPPGHPTRCLSPPIYLLQIILRQSSLQSVRGISLVLIWVIRRITGCLSKRVAMCALVIRSGSSV